MTSKDEILADFQACSGIDDVGEAFTRLEAVGWNLVQAINLSMDAESSGAAGFLVPPQAEELVTVDPDELLVPTSPAAAAAATPPATAGDKGGGGGSGGADVSEDVAGAAGGSGEATAQSTGVLQVNIQVEIGGMTGGGTFPLEVPVSTTVGELKTTLYGLLGVNPCKQVIRGFTKQTVTDSTVVTSALLGPDKTLIMDTTSAEVTSFHPYRRRATESSGPEVMEVGDSDAVQVLPSPSDKQSSLGIPTRPPLSNCLSQLLTTTEYPSSLSSSSSQNNSSNLSSSSNYNFSKHGSSSSTRKFNDISSPSSSSSGTRSKYPHIVDISDSSSSGVVALDDDDSPGVEEDSLYQLLIQDLTHKTDYTLPFPGYKTVGGVKQDVFSVTTIPVRRQRWTGWPTGCTDQTTLAMCGISKTPCMSVTHFNPNASKATPKNTRKNVAKHQSDSSSDEFEDAPELLQDDDDTFLEMMDSDHMDNKQMSLLPPSLTGSEQVLADHFVEQFTARYSSTVPLFFQGPLGEAIEQSVMLPAAQRRLLAIYVHHDGSVLANVFCSQVLCQTATVSYLADNFVLWGWDVTHAVHKDRLVANISGHIGAPAGLTVRSFRSEQLPALILLTRTRATCEVLSIIYASSSLDEVMTGMMEAVEVFESTRGAEVVEDQQRLNRKAIMNDQDAAYQESLRADRAKAELRRQQEMDEQMENQRKETLRLHEEQVTEQLRASLQSELPPEPEDTDSAHVTVMRFRHPASDQFTRAFKLDTTLQVVLNFLHVRGFPADQFKFLQSWPRRDLSSLNVAKTLREYNIPNQETITIEER